jgi:hypothetical protein
LVHATWHVPVQSASQVETLVQRMVLPEPACTPQVEALSQL